jgi:hypothetical protein
VLKGSVTRLTDLPHVAPTLWEFQFSWQWILRCGSM